jgi:Fuc2NAc and GlcNAc transferase
MIALLAWGVAAALVGGWAVGIMLRYATRREIIDHPNDRSSHVRATPRGGGMGIVATVEALLLAAALAGKVPWPVAAAVGGGGALVAAVGWVDDRRGLSARIRASVHLLAAVWAVWWLGGLPTLSLGAREWELGALGGVLAVVGIVWMTNLFNFMDGIDGLAGGQAMSTALAAALILHASAPGLAIVFIVIAGASAGFLRWNWMPARIFMGDVGSGFLGFVLAALALAAQNAGALPLVLSVVLHGVFVVDATATLIRRILAGERWYSAHRSHAYQRAVQAGASHATVAGSALLLDLLLIGCVVTALRQPAWAGGMIGISLMLLLAAYLWTERARPMRVARTSHDPG